MYKVKVTVIHALGTFTGFMALNDDQVTHENCTLLVEEMQANINNLSRLVLTRQDGSEVSLNGKILSEAILIFSIEEVK